MSIQRWIPRRSQALMELTDRFVKSDRLTALDDHPPYGRRSQVRESLDCHARWKDHSGPASEEKAKMTLA